MTNEPTPQGTQRAKLILRLVAAFLFFATMYGVYFLMVTQNDFWVVALFYPLMLGVFGQFILDPYCEMGFWKVWGINQIVMVLLVAWLLTSGLEMIICIVILLPVFVGFQIFGIMFARFVFSKWQQRKALHSVAILGLPFVLVLPEYNVSWPERVVSVSNQIEIAASPERVWNEIMDFKQVQDSERLWTISHNLLDAPKPNFSSMDGDIRHVAWTQDVTFNEDLLESREHEFVRWKFRFAPDFRRDASDTHILPNTDQLSLLDVQYEFTPTDQNTVIVHLQTRFRIKTAVNPYIALWGKQLLGDFHRSVLHVIQLRSEKIG